MKNLIQIWASMHLYLIETHIYWNKYICVFPKYFYSVKVNPSSCKETAKDIKYDTFTRIKKNIYRMQG